MTKKRIVIKPEDVTTYNPAAHQGTVNRRLICPETVGAKNLEIVLGMVDPSGLAEEHYHEKAEQAVYLVEGKCIVEVEGKSAEMKAGDICFFPPMKRHKVIPVGGAIKALVIYSPPLGNATVAFKTK